MHEDRYGELRHDQSTRCSQAWRRASSASSIASTCPSAGGGDGSRSRPATATRRGSSRCSFRRLTSTTPRRPPAWSMPSAAEHERIFAVREPGQHVECLLWKGRAIAQVDKPQLALAAPNGGTGQPRQVADASSATAGAPRRAPPASSWASRSLRSGDRRRARHDDLVRPGRGWPSCRSATSCSAGRVSQVPADSPAPPWAHRSDAPRRAREPARRDRARDDEYAAASGSLDGREHRARLLVRARSRPPPSCSPRPRACRSTSSGASCWPPPCTIATTTAPGDAFLHNDPYRGNSHAADHRSWSRSSSTGEQSSPPSRRRTRRTAATRCRPPT